MRSMVDLHATKGYAAATMRTVLNALCRRRLLCTDGLHLLVDIDRDAVGEAVGVVHGCFSHLVLVESDIIALIPRRHRRDGSAAQRQWSSIDRSRAWLELEALEFGQSNKKDEG